MWQYKLKVILHHHTVRRHLIGERSESNLLKLGFTSKNFISIENRADLFCPDKSHHISARMAAETFNISAKL